MDTKLPLLACLTALASCVAPPTIVFEQPAGPGWLADANTRCKVWDAYRMPNESVTWSGACQNGTAQGQGVLKWFRDGGFVERSEGFFVDGKMSGKGVEAETNGIYYEGNFKDGERTGSGVFVLEDGSRYEGDFVAGKLSGWGVFTRANGNRYEGNWFNGKPVGHGTATWANGDRYEGSFVNGARNGCGSISAQTGTARKACGATTSSSVVPAVPPSRQRHRRNRQREHPAEPRASAIKSQPESRFPWADTKYSFTRKAGSLWFQSRLIAPSGWTLRLTAVRPMSAYRRMS